MATLEKKSIVKKKQEITYVEYIDHDYILNLSKEEMRTLFLILRNIGGSGGAQGKSARKYSDGILKIIEKGVDDDFLEFYYNIPNNQIDQMFDHKLNCISLSEKSLGLVEFQ